MQRFPALLTLATIFSACSGDDSGVEPETQAVPLLHLSDVQTIEQLTAYMLQEYADVQVLPSIFSGGRDFSAGQLQYRLSDGTLLSIPAVYTPASGMIVDPNFDLVRYLSR